MWKQGKWIIVPMILAALPQLAAASEIRDRAELFSAEAKRKALSDLERIEREYRVPVVVETISSLEGQDIEDASLEHARRSGSRGLFVLIARKEHKIEVRDFHSFLGRERRHTIRSAFVDGLKTKDPDNGLREGVGKIEEVLKAGEGTLRPSNVPQPRRGVVPPAPARRGGGWGIGPLLWIGLAILAFFVLIRILGSLFGGAPRPYGGPAGPGAPGGYGYGGGGGGGFLSSLFGGLGGAIAGNWIYDQFSGRHHGGYGSDAGYAPPPDAGATGEEWGSAGDGGADWGGGGDGGGDWGGGGDAGGGGDWGGGGDGGGGGGDW